MLRLAPVAMLGLLLAAAVGCGEKKIPPEQAYDLQKMSGAVDKSLPAAAQARQQAIRTILLALQEGADFDALGEHHPGIRLQETYEQFLDGAINLARWDFNGAPSGDDVPVVLFLSLDSSGKNEQRVERVYKVTGAPGRFTIARKQ